MGAGRAYLELRFGYRKCGEAMELVTSNDTLTSHDAEQTVKETSMQHALSATLPYRQRHSRPVGGIAGLRFMVVQVASSAAAAAAAADNDDDDDASCSAKHPLTQIKWRRRRRRRRRKGGSL